jgi:hypothetical protein
MRDHTQKVSALVPRPPITSHYETTIVPAFPADDPRAKLAHPRGGPGAYRYRAALGIPGRGEAHDSVDFEELFEQGDSLLIISSAASGARVELDRGAVGSLILSANARAHLSGATFEIEAKDFADARRIGFNTLMPLLSHLAFESDTAVTVVAVEILELASGTISLASRLMGQQRPLRLGASGTSTPERRALLAAYREANNAMSVLVRALYYYQVIEGVFRLRTSRTTASAAQGMRPTEPHERFPETTDGLPPWVFDTAPFEPYLGKKFTGVRDELKSTIRNASAHLDPNGDSFVADSFEDIEAATRAVPVLHCMARIMLADELERQP